MEHATHITPRTMALSIFSRDPFLFGLNEWLAPSPFIARDPFDGLMPVISSLDRNLDDMVVRHSSPGYKINENDDKYQISMDLPGVKASDVSAQNRAGWTSLESNRRT